MTTATAETIRRLREAAGLSRRDLAEAAGISHVFLSKLETGERRPSPQTLVKIAAALGLSVGELTGKIAVVEATAAPTDAEMQRRLLRAAAIGGGAAAVVAGLIPGVGIVAAAAAGASMLAGRRKKSVTPDAGDELSDVEGLRSALLVKVRHMPADQLTLLAALADEVWPQGDASTARTAR